MVSGKKREVADENHMSLSKWDEEPCFVCECVKDVISYAMEKSRL